MYILVYRFELVNVVYFVKRENCILPKQFAQGFTFLLKQPSLGSKITVTVMGE